MGSSSRIKKNKKNVGKQIENATQTDRERERVRKRERDGKRSRQRKGISACENDGCIRREIMKIE